MYLGCFMKGSIPRDGHSYFCERTTLLRTNKIFRERWVRSEKKQIWTNNLDC